MPLTVIVAERLVTKKAEKYLLGEPWPDDALPGQLYKACGKPPPDKPSKLLVGAIFRVLDTLVSWRSVVPDKDGDLETRQSEVLDLHEVWQMPGEVFVEFYKRINGTGDREKTLAAVEKHPEMLLRTFRNSSSGVSFDDEMVHTYEALERVFDRFVKSKGKSDDEDEEDEDETPAPPAGNGQQPQAQGG